MDKYEALLSKIQQSEDVPEWVVDEIQSTYEASGLRTDLKETRDKYRDVLTTNTKLRDRILAEEFTKHGVTISPTALRIPDDLDPTDAEKVEGWLVQSGLTSTKPTTSVDERSTHDRIVAATDSAATPTVDLSQFDPTTMDEDEFYRKYEAAKATIRR